MIATAEHVYAYPRPALTADVVVLSEADGRDRVLLIRRGIEPFRGMYALPGGHVEQGEPIDAAARRELLEETRLEVASVRQVGTYGDPGRDPRGWVVSVAFVARISLEQARTAVAGDDADLLGWFDLDDLPPLAFDHARLIDDAVWGPREEGARP